MAKNLLNLTETNITRSGSKVRAYRKVSKGTLTYELLNTQIMGVLDINTIVYEMMILAANDQIELGHVLYKGDWTAAELAGKVYSVPMFTENANEDYEEYSLVKIVTPTFACSFAPGIVFEQIAEWEGMAGITGKNQHKFCCYGKEMPKDVELKKYTRCHGYKPTTISFAMENARIAKKFEVLGDLYKALTSEGMRKALSALTAIRCFDNVSYETRSLAKTAILRKLWKDYAREKDGLLQPIDFSEQDFKNGPEIWKQVDKGYAAQLVTYFQELMRNNPTPEWPKKDDLIQLKNQDTAPKKWQGALRVCKVYGELDIYHDTINWFAEISTTKGKWDSMIRSITIMEPWVAAAKVKKTKPKAKATKEATVKVDPCTVKDDAGKDVTFDSYVPNVGYEEAPKPMTIEERLRAALRKQLSSAA